MKKFFVYLILIIILLIPITVLAEGNISVSPQSLNLEVGETKTFTITAYNVVGDAKIKSNDTNIVTLDNEEWETGIIEEEQTKVSEITIKGIAIGSTEIVLTLDAATFDSEDLSGQTRTLYVNVVEKVDNELENQTNDLEENTNIEEAKQIDVPNTKKNNYITIGLIILIIGIIIFTIIIIFSKKNKIKR